MNAITSLAVLDLRRLAIGSLLLAAFAGVLPAIMQAVGLAGSAAAILCWTLGAVGAAVGASFGNDFSGGRGSFFFARPLTTAQLFAGRALAAAIVATGSSMVFLLIHSFTRRGQEGRDPISSLDAAQVFVIGWVLGLFGGLSVAANLHKAMKPPSWTDALRIPLRTGSVAVGFMLVFMLFVDLTVRAYPSRAPIRLFFGWWVFGCLIAAVAAITVGRTDLLRLSRVMNRILLGHLLLTLVSTTAVWAYAVHPGSSAIRRIEEIAPAGQGDRAFLLAQVNRGDRHVLNRVFLLDTASGVAERFDSTGIPRFSGSGAVMIYEMGGPVFMPAIRRWLSGDSGYRMRLASGEESRLSLPEGLEGSRFLEFVPSDDGELVATSAHGAIWLLSRSGALTTRHVVARDSRVASLAFSARGTLVAAIEARDHSSLSFHEVDPRTGAMTALGPPIPGGWNVRFAPTAARAVLVSRNLRNADVRLVDLDASPIGPPVTLASGEMIPSTLWLDDGRLVVSSAETEPPRVFDRSGTLSLQTTIPGVAAREPFPGIIAVQRFREGVSLVDATSGKLVRTIPEIEFLWRVMAGGTGARGAAARLVVDRNGVLYQLPSATGDLRRLLPAR